MRDGSYFETWITCSRENSFVCLSHSCGNYVPRVGHWAVPPLFAFLCVFIEGQLVWLKEESRGKNKNALTGRSSTWLLLRTYCVFSPGIKGADVWPPSFLVLLWFPKWSLLLWLMKWEDGQEPQSLNCGQKLTLVLWSALDLALDLRPFSKLWEKIETSA